jgi:hypothetical protein
MSVDAMAESLNFPNQKRRAVASRSYRVKISPNNGQTFTAGQTVNIDMPSNLAGTYVNWNQCYLKFKAATATNPLTLDRCGAAGLISRIQCQTAGAQIFDLPNWNVLMTLLMDMDSSPAYKAGVGNVLMGTRGGYQAGEQLTTTARTFCVPFVLHPFGMSTPHRLMPLFSSSPVQFKIVLESLVNSGYAAAASLPTAINYSEFELVCVCTELSPGSQAVVDQMSGGMYNILCSSYQNVGTTMSAASTSVTTNLGISVSSLERIIVCHRPTSVVNQQSFYSLGARTKNGLTEYSIFINGEQYPARSIKIEDNGAEALAEFLLSDHSLVNFDKQSSFNLALVGTTGATKSNGLDGQSVNSVATPFIFEGTAAAGSESGSTAGSPSNIGSFVTAVELETGLSQGKSALIYSGVSTVASTVSYRGVYTGVAGTTVEAQIDFFAQFTVLLSLNTRGTNVWAVSV